MADTTDKKSLSLDGARKVLDAALAEAKKQKFSLSIAIVDDAGHLLAYARMDEAGLASVRVSVAKARCAALFKRPTKAWEETFATRPAIANLPGVLPIEGGVPLIVSGKVVGAIGASGASSAQDGQVAAVGAATLG
jgi:glc operon protein GlcG